MTTALTALELDEIRTGLQTERDALLAQVANLSDGEATLKSAGKSFEDRVRSSGDPDMISVERSLVARMSTTMATGLAELDAALARIEAGTYGTCTGCGSQIPAARLAARPRSATCVACASTRR